MYSQRFKEIKKTTLKNQMKPLQLGKVGKSEHGECKIEQGKIVFLNQDKTIKTVWEN